MAQYLISAPPKTGKTMYVIELIFSILHRTPERLIVTNIIGIDIPGVISVTGTLHKPLDWRDYPNGTVVIYDEAHEHPAFTKDDLLKDVQIDETRFNTKEKLINNDDSLTITQKKDLIAQVNRERKLSLHRYKESIVDIARGLTLHGHFGFDIYFITQDVRRMNDIALAATNDHIILRRLFKLPGCIVYKFAEVQRTFSGTSRSNAISIGFYRHKKYLRKFYISGEYHNNTPTAPLGLIALVLLVIGIFSYAYYNLKQSNSFGAFDDNKSKETVSNIDQSQSKNHNELAPVSSSKSALDTTQSSSSVSIDEQLKIQELVKLCVSNDRSLDDCRSLYDPSYEKNKRDQIVIDRNRQQSIVSYDPSNPYEKMDNLDYQATNKPIFSGCMKTGKNQYKAYTQQGTLIKVDPSVCKRLLEDNDRPFNYFKESSPVASNTGAKTEYSTVDNYQERREVINKRDNPHLYLEPDQKLVTSSYQNTIKD